RRPHPGGYDRPDGLDGTLSGNTGRAVRDIRRTAYSRRDAGRVAQLRLAAARYPQEHAHDREGDAFTRAEPGPPAQRARNRQPDGVVLAGLSGDAAGSARPSTGLLRGL